MTGIGNNFGPRSAMGMNNAQNLQNLQKTDKSGLVGEPKEATANPDGLQGETEVNRKVKVYWDLDDNGEPRVTGVEYNGINDGIVEYYWSDGTPCPNCYIDDDLHNYFRDNPTNSDN